MIKAIISILFHVGLFYMAQAIITTSIAFAGLTGLVFALLISAPLFIGAFSLRRIILDAL